MEDWVKFDITNTQDFDASMASGYALLLDLFTTKKSIVKDKGSEDIDVKRLFGFKKR